MLPSSTQQLSLSQMMKNAGFPDSAIPTGLAIVQAESGGNPTATNHNTNGSTDYGLFQINSVHSDLLAAGDWRNPQTNVNMAYEVWRNAGGSWSPWSTYNSGNYAQYMGAATAAFTAPPSGHSGAPIPGPIFPWGRWFKKINPVLPTQPAPAPMNPQPGLPKAPSSKPAPGKGNTLAGLLPPHFGFRFLWFLLGLLLLVAGTIILFRKPLSHAVADGAKAAKVAALA